MRKATAREPVATWGKVPARGRGRAFRKLALKAGARPSAASSGCGPSWRAACGGLADSDSKQQNRLTPESGFVWMIAPLTLGFLGRYFCNLNGWGPTEDLGRRLSPRVSRPRPTSNTVTRGLHPSVTAGRRLPCLGCRGANGCSLGGRGRGGRWRDEGAQVVVTEQSRGCEAQAVKAGVSDGRLTPRGVAA